MIIEMSKPEPIIDDTQSKIEMIAIVAMVLGVLGFATSTL